jgi:two-component system, OmpR family, sensor histidine kinase SenX3
MRVQPLAALSIETPAVATASGEPFAARDEFVSLASHELMTPVTSLRLQTERMRRLLAQKPQEANGDVAAMLDVFDRQLGRLSLLCDELVSATSIEASELSLVREASDLSDLVRRAVEDVAAQIPQARRAVDLRVETALVGRWDGEQIVRMLLHLVKNAITFGEGKPVLIELTMHEGRARLAVRDQGIGIEKADQERIFERFERAVPSSHFGGLGLGLYIARAIARAHGGAIWVESAPGAGATFTVDLPLDAQDQRGATREGTHGHAIPAHGAQHKPGRIKRTRAAARRAATRRGRNRAA